MNVIMPELNLPEPNRLEQVGRYRIIGELGRGAMGVVYRASDPAIGRSVAIKTIRISALHEPEEQEKLRERLFREARSAGVLSHPNIVTIYDMDEDSGLAYIAMAFVNGPTLEQILGAAEPLSGARMLRVLRQTASALDYAHGRGIVHRDIKPANIMTDEDGSVKVTDFGIARMTARHEGTLNEDDTISGTPNYMSPEQVQGTPLDGRSDQFSLAVIAYEILTGERPFPGEHLSTIVYKIVAEEPQPAHRLNSTLTPRIDEVLRKALAKNPEERFPNCSNFVGALELACAESRGWTTLAAGAGAGMPTIAVDRLEVAERVEMAAAPVPDPAERGQPSRTFALLMSALVVAGLAAVFLYQTVSPRRAPDALPAPAQTAVVPEKRTEPKPVEVVAAEPPIVQAMLPLPEPIRTEPAPEPRLAPSPFPPVASPPAHLQDIWITTSPAGSLAVLDGNQGLSCVAPCQLHGAPGVHRLIVSQAGYLTEVREIRIEDSALTVPRITLRQPSGTLMLTTNPPGASIRINGELQPRVTPAELSLRPGSYSVTVEKDGIARTERIQLRESPFYLRIPLAH